MHTNQCSKKAYSGGKRIKNDYKASYLKTTAKKNKQKKGAICLGFY